MIEYKKLLEYDVGMTIILWHFATNQEEKLDNSLRMKQFTETYHKEISALIEDLDLKDVKFYYDGRLPNGLDQDFSLMWEWCEIEEDDASKSSIVIAFCWHNIIEAQQDLRYGLIFMAQCLRSIAQYLAETGSSEQSGYQCSGCETNTYEIEYQDTVGYTYECIQRLFNLFTDEEVETLAERDCLCNRCRKGSSNVLDQHDVLENEVTGIKPRIEEEIIKHKQLTKDFFEVYKDEVNLVLKDLKIPGSDFGIDGMNKPSNERFSEMCISHDLEFFVRLDWDVLPSNFSREQKFRAAALEVMKNTHLIWQIKEGSFDGFLPGDRNMMAREYVEEVIYDFAKAYPESRFRELITSEHYTMTCLNDDLDGI